MVYLDNSPKSGDILYSVKISKGDVSGFLALDKIMYIHKESIRKQMKRTNNRSTMFHEFFILKSKDIQDFCRDLGYKVEIIETIF